MTNNDILRRLRYAFNLNNQQACRLFYLHPNSRIRLKAEDFQARLTKPEEAGFHACSDQELATFLDGLIILKRGFDKNAPVPADIEHLSRNEILKKLRIALNFREQDMLNTFLAGGTTLSKSELSAFFRKPEHKHYRVCGNQILRSFLKGLTLQLRPTKN